MKQNQKNSTILYNSIIFIVLILVQHSYCRLGIDHSEPTTIQQFKCLLNINQSFIIYRAWKSYSAFDINVVKSLQNAKQAGYKPQDISIYLFPCYSTVKSPQSQIQQMIQALQSHKSEYSRIWIDVQTNPSSGCGWSSNYDENCIFLERLVMDGKKYGKSMGIYASNHMWNVIMGGESRCNKFMDLPIWYAHYDNLPNFSDWKPFGGWAKPNIKQYKGTVTLCGINGVDLNFSQK